MSKLNLYYRAFKDYRKITKNSAETINERKSIIQVNQDLDSFTTTKFICTIEDDWVKEIEEGLKFVEKAIAEERQFIRVQGDTIPIEKVKKVGKASFEHLAKHSNMITHVPEHEGDTLVPDELYIVEKLNDYAVYENRFLYMLLKYLQDFISFRMDKIDELRSTYIGDFKVNKKIENGKRHLTIEERIYEKREDNPFPIPDDKTERMISRIKDCSSIVNALINCPLMSEVSKSPLLKPPITKTNVLKMNNNFKKSLALYEYVSAYKGLGYTFEEVKTDYHPFNEKFYDEVVDSMALTSFITYKLGNDLDRMLERDYEVEEREKKDDEDRKLDERIRRMKKKAAEGGKSLEEYMAYLEMRNQQLLHDSEELHLARNEIVRLNEEIDKLNQERKEFERRIDELKEEIEDKIREISRLNQKYIEDMMAIRKKHNEHIKELKIEYEDKLTIQKDEYEAEIQGLTENHRLELQELSDKHQDELNSLEERFNSNIEDLKERQDIEIKKYKDKISTLDASLKEITNDRNEKVKSYEEKIKETINGYEKSLKEERDKNDGYLYEKNLFKAELDAKRVLEGSLTPCDEYATRERFLELEEEYEAFERFFTQEWKVARAKIKAQMKDPNSEINKRVEEEIREKIEAKNAKSKKHKKVNENENTEVTENVSEETNSEVNEETSEQIIEHNKEE